MLSRKKNKKSTIKMMHFEGLSNMPTNATCNIFIKDAVLVFEQVLNRAYAELPINRIASSSYLRDVDYMLQYKNAAIQNPKSSLDIIMYWVIKYVGIESIQENLVVFKVMLPDAKGVELFIRNIPIQSEQATLLL